MLTGGVRCVVGGACNRCRKFGHFGKYCVYLNERFPDLIESYHSKVISDRRNSNQINQIEMETDDIHNNPRRDRLPSATQTATNPATEQMKAFDKAKN